MNSREPVVCFSVLPSLLFPSLFVSLDMLLAVRTCMCIPRKCKRMCVVCVCSITAHHSTVCTLRSRPRCACWRLSKEWHTHIRHRICAVIIRSGQAEEQCVVCAGVCTPHVFIRFDFMRSSSTHEIHCILHVYVCTKIYAHTSSVMHISMCMYLRQVYMSIRRNSMRAYVHTAGLSWVQIS